ncbi:MAG: metalloregulator ArsR/SmtB family transcription factor [Mariprofundaceae bacterium]|nr:metalloregulator ArsR/SmtB family transcription factor [Mariprofundaceae bacterium]
MDLVQLFKGLSDPIRLRVVHLLCQKGELCVCHLTEALSLPQSTISRHLSILRNSGLVETERRGKWVYYSMRDTDCVKTISSLIKADSVENETLQGDLSKLKNPVC